MKVEKLDRVAMHVNNLEEAIALFSMAIKREAKGGIKMTGKFKRQQVMVSVTISLALMLLLGAYAPASAVTPASTLTQMAAAKPAATPSPSAPAMSHAKVELMIFSAPAPGASYGITFGIHSIINKYHPWIKMKFQETQGVGDAAKWANELPKGQRDQSIIMPSDPSYWGILAGDPGYPKLPDLRLIMPTNIGATILVTFKPEIKTINDLVGKTLAHAAISWGGWPQHEVAFKAAGILDKIKIKHIGLAASATALRDGQVDAAVTFISYVSGKWMPSSTIEELRSNKKLYFIDFPDQRPAWLKITGRPFAWAQVPAGVVYNDTAFGVTAMNVNQMATFANNDPEIVYEILKTLFDHWAEYQTYEASLKGRTLEGLVSAFHVNSLDEIHPGAVKFFQEKKLKIPITAK